MVKARKATPDELKAMGIDPGTFKKKPAPAPQPVPAAPPSPAPSPSPSPAQPVQLEDLSWKPDPLKFADAADLFLYFTPEVALHPWQVQTLVQLAGNLNPRSAEKTQPTRDKPFLFNFVAANGSGKDKTIIAPFAAWFCCTKVRSKVVITSSSHDQLKGQTFKYLVELCEKINSDLGEKVFDIIEFLITCKRTKSSIKLVRSDDPGKVEGQHAEFGGEFAVIVNEAKSIDDDIHSAFMRYTGWNYWIEISSPGGMSGHFYRRSMSARATWPAIPTLGEIYLRKVTAFECPHLMDPVRLKLIQQEHGINSPLYKSSILAEFSLADELTLIPSTAIIYPRPNPRDFGLPRKAGLDIGLGGDETVLDVWEGNQRVGIEAFSVGDQAMLHHILLRLFAKYGLHADNIIADFGGIGKPIVQRIWEAGWPIRTINNEGPPLNKKDYLNRGAENWCRIKRLIEEKYLILPTLAHGAEAEDTKLIGELTMRRYEITNGKIALEKKADMRARGLSSPNRADALALVFADVPITQFFDVPSDNPTPKPISREALVEFYDRRNYAPRGLDKQPTQRYVDVPRSRHFDLLST